MAILAMQQYAQLLLGLDPELVPVSDLNDMERGRIARRAMVWLPVYWLDGAELPEKSWRLTSDSLALWLADQLGARCVYLVKAAPLAPAQYQAEKLAGQGMLDELFPAVLRKISVEVFWCCAGDYSAFPARSGQACPDLSTIVV